jgi:HEAT repeat protein
MQDRNWGMRQVTAEALGEIGVASDEVCAALGKALNDEVLQVRMDSAEAIGKMPQAAAKLVHELVLELITERSGNVAQGNAATALGAAGAAARSAEPDLEKAAHGDDSYLRPIAAAALARIRAAQTSSDNP